MRASAERYLRVATIVGFLVIAVCWFLFYAADTSSRLWALVFGIVCVVVALVDFLVWRSHKKSD